MPWAESSSNDNTRPPKIEPAVFVLAGIAALIVYVSWQNGTVDKPDLVYYAVLIPAIILHEISHGALAYVFGDPTAKRAGRLTLNPLRHVDPWGTFIIPGVLLIAAGFAFGYAKPVPVNTSRMSRNQAMFTGLIGPATNVVLAMVAVVSLHAINQDEVLGWAETALYQFGIANVVLAVFNMIPIPPLDGSSVIERFLPSKYWPQYLKFRQYSMIILIFIMFFAASLVQPLFGFFISAWESLLPAIPLFTSI